MNAILDALDQRFSIAPSPVRSWSAGTLKIAVTPEAPPDLKEPIRDEYVYVAPVALLTKRPLRVPVEPKVRKVHGVQQVRNPAINNRTYGVPKRSREECAAEYHEFNGKSLWRKDGINKQGHQKYQCLSCGVNSKDKSENTVGAKPIQRDCDHVGYKLWHISATRRRCANCRGSWTVKP